MSPNELRAINRQHRLHDDSNLWPIRGRFSVANRAIRQAYLFMRDYGNMTGDEYTTLLDSLESEIVNNPRNW